MYTFRDTHAPIHTNEYICVALYACKNEEVNNLQTRIYQFRLILLLSISLLHVERKRLH